MKSILFIGDSITTGENNSFKSYVDYYKEYNKKYIINKKAVSGACFDNYSIYPVDESLFSIICDIDESYYTPTDFIYLQFGLNDLAAVVSHTVSFEKITISLIRCLDFLKQIYPNAKVKFLYPTSPENAHTLCANYVKYLNEDYLNKYFRTISEEQFEEDYRLLLDVISNILEVEMLDKTGEVFSKYFCEDNIHPSDKGYSIIAKNLSVED